MKITIITILVVLGCVTLNAQPNFVNNEKIYQFFERQHALGRIDVNIHQKPWARGKIAVLLEELNTKSDKLNSLELDELHYWISEYNMFNSEEESSNTFIGRNETGAFRFYEYDDTLFHFSLYPDIGASYSFRDDEKYVLMFYNGASVYGNVNGNISFDFDYNDVSYKSDGIKQDNFFNEKRGVDYPRSLIKKIYNYDRITGGVAINWKWGLFSLRKDYNFWGAGESGKLILSDKAPSYPHIQLKMYPADWIEFNYIYGELMSSIDDSLTIRVTGTERNHIQVVQKYHAAHFVTFDILKHLKVSLGESVIISDKFEPIYLIPVLFFRIADHYNSNTDYNSSNAQVFASMSWRVPAIKTRFDFSLFVDEYSTSNLFGNDNPDRLAYSFGVKHYDLILKNSSLAFEYVRINPYVYEHGDPAQTYYNRNYQMGHWIGQNADQLYFAYSYKPQYNMYLKLSCFYVRKGDFVDSETVDAVKGPRFLFGNTAYLFNYSFVFEYEYLNNLFLYSSLEISNSWGGSKTLNLDDYRFIDFTTGFRYGFR